jgi:hypothetical protein
VVGTVLTVLALAALLAVTLSAGPLPLMG